MTDEPYPGALESAREITRIASAFDTTAASSAVAAIRELQSQHIVDMSGIREALKDWQATQAHDVLKGTSALLVEMRAAEGLKATAELVAGVNADVKSSLQTIADTYASTVREAVQSVQIADGWRAQVRETVEALSASSAITEQMRAVLAARQPLPARFTITPAFRAALAEAEALVEAADEEGAPPDSGSPFAHLTDAQRLSVQFALLGAISEIASNVAFFIGSRRLDAAAHLLALLVMLFSLYAQIGRPPE